jgi:hypothetical protein
MKVADDFDFIRRRRDELRGGDLDTACGTDLDMIGQGYHVHRKANEGDYDYRARIKAER